jgi:hypothetical protein
MHQSRPLSSGPAPDEIHIWRVGLDGDDRRGATRAALTQILGGYLGAPWPAALEVAPGGKPRLAETPERLAFNLSHSGGLALIAVAPGGVEVGVDVEQLRPRRDLVRLAARWLPQDDAAAVGAAAEDERELVFYAAWARLEARVKCTGAGLGGPRPRDTVVARELAIDPGYAAAVAFDLGSTGGMEPRISLRRRWLAKGASCRG